jgi:isocitrate/isopropylmalate dehydrogenase
LAKANPLAAILAAGMLLEHVGEKTAADAVEKSVIRLLTSGRVKSIGTDSGIPTHAMGDMAASEIAG